ncbi:acetoacetate--CoA ligase [Streptomyces sp. NPDC001833]|uniref:acetoacetate--CoA ligase n=1 Tax=Streptomyces sp. NPDC001833 TaxID=3154658 RepID=UPI003320E16A
MTSPHPPEQDSSPVWTPAPADLDTANIEDFRRWLTERHDLRLADYHALHAWSVDHLEQFWSCLWEYFDVRAAQRGDQVLADATMPGARWFPGTRLNYVDQILRHQMLPGTALIAESEPGGPEVSSLSWPELRRQVAAVAHTFRGLGIQKGDRVVGYLPDVPQAVVSFLAAASIGAVWSVCGQEYSADAALARFEQLEPTVLVAADGYHYAGRPHSRLDAVEQLRKNLPTLRATVLVPRLGRDIQPTSGVIGWSKASAGEYPLAPVAVDFDHPLWVLFSSGTTGKPKGIVHGHGGVLLEHLKQIALHCNLRAGDTYLGYTSPSWMMWNYQVAALLVGAKIVCYDGSPGHPNPDYLWGLAARHHATVLQTSPSYLQACETAGVRPAAEHDLSSLRSLRVTGSVLSPSSARWAARELGPRVAISSASGGTDVVSGFVGSVPTLPFMAGELTAPCLGVALESWDPRGQSVRDQVGELVVTKPMPSMPLAFWDDPDGSRLRGTYFDAFPGVWRHGDWITITERGSVIMHGRSDATLNRNGVRMGSADIYQVVERLPEVAESLVVGVEQPDGGYWMPLFVVLTEGIDMSPELARQITTAIREGASPRHVPDEVIAVPGIPHTLTGKKLEVPIKRILQGASPDTVLDSQSVDDPGLLGDYVHIAKARAASA